MAEVDDGRARCGVEYGKAWSDIPDELDSGRIGTLNSALSGELAPKLGTCLGKGVGTRLAEAGRANIFVGLPSLSPDVEESMEGAGDGLGVIGIALVPLSEMGRP